MVETAEEEGVVNESSYVVVTMEEVELSLSEVVAMPGEDEEEEEAGVILESRVRATREVAEIHEFALLQRTANARELVKELSGEEVEDEARRLSELEASLRSVWENTLTAEIFQGSVSTGNEIPDLRACQNVDAVMEYLMKRGRNVTFRVKPVKQESNEMSFADASEAQARKDIERDALVLSTDGSRVSVNHAEAYDSVVKGLANAAAKLVHKADATEWRFVDTEDFRALAKYALRAVNRTESGGLGLETLADILPDCLAPVPDSKNADPLHIDLSLGPACLDDIDAPRYTWRWGLRARVTGTTLYRLFPTNSDFLESGPVALARATYSNFLLLPLDALDTSSPRSHSVLFDRRRASVHLNIHLADDAVSAHNTSSSASAKKKIALPFLQQSRSRSLLQRRK